MLAAHLQASDDALSAMWHPMDRLHQLPGELTLLPLRCLLAPPIHEVLHALQTLCPCWSALLLWHWSAFRSPGCHGPGLAWAQGHHQVPPDEFA